MNTLEELYALKGQAITEIEIWQSKLERVNRQIADLLNSKPLEQKKDHLQNGKS